MVKNEQNYVHVVFECPPVYYCSVRCRACLNHLGQMPVGFLGSFGQVGWQVLRRSGAGGLRAGEVFVASKNMLVVRHLRYILCTGVAFFREMRLKHGARPPSSARNLYVLLKMLARACTQPEL